MHDIFRYISLMIYFIVKMWDRKTCQGVLRRDGKAEEGMHAEVLSG